jgi:signal transduction histidine kinase
MFAVLTYFGVRHILVVQRETVDLQQSFVNAALVRNTIADNHSVPRVLESIDAAGSSRSLVEINEAWTPGSPSTSPSEIPLDQRDDVPARIVTRQITIRNGEPNLSIAIPIPALNAAYYEIFPLQDLEHTLRLLLFLLGVGALATTLVGVSGGLWLTRRAVRPLERVSRAAEQIAEGALSTRLPVTPADREIEQLTQSFNTMVDHLIAQQEKDARFASDVSHELRSPLTTLATTASLLQHNRAGLSPTGQEALDLLVADLGIFQTLVEELLEMARADAGSVQLHLEELPIDELIRQCVTSAARRLQVPLVPVETAGDFAHVRVLVDRRRFERVITNLIDNAKRYAGGASAIRLDHDERFVYVNVDDAGEGLAPTERERVFERFYRGSAANSRGAARGTGLGLFLVADHVALVGGSIEILSSPEGGARFRITLPLHEETE